MYVGLALAYVGEAGILKQAWPLVVLPFTLAYVHFIVVPLEEQRLEEVFSDYGSYQKRVRRWL